jgi:hypothetical protein
MASVLNDKWRTSSRSESVNCVQARIVGSVVQLRDSKNPDSGTLQFDAPQWREFLDAIDRGDYDVRR